eukprot:NODE_10261_length_312_cov_31.774319.p3 GENE.NODE_10261_length_312_cov_31.774319~~NODE_10261_length_312_cov_31.774319.p3  ORF type:complete len:58 (+),score=16.17 NODE_10261_length_312_cov_31.774319:3-176(+)
MGKADIAGTFVCLKDVQKNVVKLAATMLAIEDSVGQLQIGSHTGAQHKEPSPRVVSL